MKKFHILIRQPDSASVYCQMDGKWNLEKEICPLSLQPVNRLSPWLTHDEPTVRYKRLNGEEKVDLLVQSVSPFVFVSERAKEMFESQGLSLQFRLARKSPFLEYGKENFQGDFQDSLYFVQCSNRLALDYDRTAIAWQKDCPGCGKTYPLFHTMKNPVVVAPKGSDTRIFTLEPWPDSYMYISQDTLKEWKKLGLTGIENIKKPFGMLDIQ